MAINNYIKWPAERIRQDENNRLVSDLQITTWNGKADADHNHDDKYIPLSGTVALTGSIYPLKGKPGIAIGNPSQLFEMMAAKVFYAGGSSPKVQISGISDNGYITINGKNRSGEDIGCQIQPSPDSSSNSICYLPVNSGTFALTKDIPESLKNPNVISIQLNGGDATEYDGSAAKSIDITPASIGAAASGDLDNYIPLTGTTALSGDIVPNKNASIELGATNYPFSGINCKTLFCVDSNANVRLQIGDNGIVFKSQDNSENYGVLNVGLLANTFIAWSLPDKSGIVALTSDIPKSLPASDVKDWAKADSKPTYTFAEITEKPDKFTPDTHTHTISEVTDLQTTLDGKAAKNHVHDSEKVTNWNNAVVSGVYYAEADAVNNPSADAAYSGNVIKGSTIVTQTVVKETIDGDLYKYIRRGQLDTNRTTVTTWGQWQEIQYVVAE